MKERGILFSAPMVRAILAGEKTQTRRVMNPQPEYLGARGGKTKRDCWTYLEGFFRSDEEFQRTHPNEECPSPYGAPGDRLWVRETWAPDPNEPDGTRSVFYRATDPAWDELDSGLKWKPSIFMPRWASRITLEVTGVRVERVQDISAVDVAREAVTYQAVADLTGLPMSEVGVMSLSEMWQAGWTAINGAESWASNPWVWVIEFRRCT